MAMHVYAWYSIRVHVLFHSRQELSMYRMILHEIDVVHNVSISWL
jgi:hypothetical protein